MGEFVTVGKTGDIGESGLAAFDVKGRRVAVAHVEGTFYAFDDVCTHAECSLAEGDLDGTHVECPCHGSVFDATSGEVVNGPATEPVGTFAVRVDGDSLQIEA